MPKKPKDDDDLLGLTGLAKRLDKADDDDEPKADDESKPEPETPSEAPSENA